MTIYKRIGSFLLSLLLVFSMFGSTFAIQTFAATSPALSAESKTVKAGEQFTVAVSLANATTVYGGNFTLQYDSSLLTADSYEFSSIVSGHTKNCNLNYQSAGNLIRVTFSGASAVTSSGTLITFTFTAKENVSGSAALQFNAYKMYDENGSSITSTATGSAITISSGPVVTPAISVTSKTVTVGDTVSVPVVITNSSEVYGGNFTLQYDSNLLTADSYSFGSIVSGHTKNCNLNYQSAGNLIRVTFSGAGAVSSDGTLITLTFTAKSAGTAALKFTEYKMYDDKGSSITTTATGNTIVIEPKPEPDSFITGQCGSNVYFDLNLDDGTIVIYGEGDMYGKYYYLNNDLDTPWYDYRDSITNVEIKDGVTSVSYWAFGYCENITKVSIADSVELIEEYAFGHTNINSLILPKNLTTIEDDAFRGTGISSVTIPDSVTDIGKYVFGSCQNLTEIVVDDNNECYCSQDGVLFDKDKVTLIQYPSGKAGSPYVIPSGVEIIDKQAFGETNGLSSVTLSNTVSSIGSYAFYGCFGLKTITFSKSVTSIKDGAFTSCPAIADVYYLGTKEEWNNISIGAYNDYLTNATLHYVKATSMSISSNPSKTTYYIGDALSTSGLKLLVTYSDGTTETITSGFTTSGFSSTTAETKTVTVSYEGFTDTFTVTVKTPSITLSSGSKTMSVGDTSSITATTTPSGQTITWTSSNTSVATVSDGTITAKVFGSTTITAKFTYNGKTYSKTCSVTVEDVHVPPTPESLSVSSKPTKTTYEIGESLNTSGLKLKLTYSDGTYETITSGFITSGFSSTTAGTKTVTVKYSGLTTTFTVTVTSTPPTPTSLSVSTKPTKTTYEIGESLNTSGLKLKLTYSDGTYETITSGFTTSGFSSTTAGTKTVTVKYSGLTTTFTVTVTSTPDPTPTSLAVSTKPTKTTYEIGESLNTNGLKLKLTYSDGTYETITSGFTTSGFSSTTAGTKTVTVKYGSLTTTFTVTVNAPTPIDGSRVTVESKKARVGSTVLITVSLEENPGIWGMDLVVNYDKTQLTLTSVTNGTVFSSSEWTQGNLSGDKYILSYEASGFDNITTNGVLATLEFTVNENATVDSFASISLSYNAGDIINVSFDDINVAIVSGGINITDFVYGDLNSDGLVNKKDSLLMKMYLADNSTTIDMQAADVYVDGSINKKDSLYLKQYLAGLDVELGA